MNGVPVARVSTSSCLTSLETKRRNFLSLDFTAVYKCTSRNTVIRCSTARRSSERLGPRDLLLISSNKRCLRKAASVAEAFTLNPIASRVGSVFAEIYHSGVGLTGTEFGRNYSKLGFSVLTERPL